MSYKDGFGLREKIHDGTEFNVGAFIQLPAKSELPRKFTIAPLTVITQKDDTCAKEASQNLMSYINGVQLNNLIAWVVGRANANYKVEDYGIDIKTILMACVKVGALLPADSPFDSTKDDRAIYADVTKWDLKTLLPKAVIYKAGSAVFVEPTNGMDYFDTIRAVMVKLKAPVIIGIRWNFDPKNPLIDKASETGYGHAVLLTGWDDDKWLGREVILNSWGTTVGDQGYFYPSREMINHDVALFGAGTLIDETPERIKWYLDNKIYLDDTNWLTQLIKVFVAALKRIATPVVGVPPYPPKITQWAMAVQTKEGWYPGSRSRRNHNPGNARYCGQYKAIGEDRSGVPLGTPGFAIFPDDETGMDYLCRILYNDASGRSVAYNSEAKKLGLVSGGELNMLQFCGIYAPLKDGNTPDKYAADVCSRLGVSPYAPIKNLL